MNAEDQVSARLQIVDEHIRRENEHDLTQASWAPLVRRRVLTTSLSMRIT
jgi:hypothetical protein